MQTKTKYKHELYNLISLWSPSHGLLCLCSSQLHNIIYETTMHLSNSRFPLSSPYTKVKDSIYSSHSTSSRQHNIHCILVVLLTKLQCCILDELSLTRYIWCYEVCTDIWAILKGKHACIEATTSIFGVNRITDPQRAWCWRLWCLLI